MDEKLEYQQVDFKSSAVLKVCTMCPKAVRKEESFIGCVRDSNALLSARGQKQASRSNGRNACLQHVIFLALEKHLSVIQRNFKRIREM